MKFLKKFCRTGKKTVKVGQQAVVARKTAEKAALSDLEFKVSPARLQWRSSRRREANRLTVCVNDAKNGLPRVLYFYTFLGAHGRLLGATGTVVINLHRLPRQGNAVASALLCPPLDLMV
ncbi:unnamed protein product [Dibothriocephalus latus]|uniref:Uncharacterized protein n=1 Tax=Dibothriocephalus latus TaxID=60516 RepID=A0A3P7MC23_DIBLA|nr:unnamed protein product [Dibothriocephalus latus]